MLTPPKSHVLRPPSTLASNLIPAPIPHVSYILDKTLLGFKNLWPLFNKNSSLRSEIKLFCYKQLIRPLISSGFVVWCDLSSHQMERLKARERRLSHTALNPHHPLNNQDVYDAVSTIRIDVFLTKSLIKLLSQAQTYPNELVRRCVPEQPSAATNFPRSHQLPVNILSNHN